MCGGEVRMAVWEEEEWRWREEGGGLEEEGTGGDGRDEGCGGGERRSEPRAEAGSLRQRCVCKSVSDIEMRLQEWESMRLHASVAGMKGHT